MAKFKIPDSFNSEELNGRIAAWANEHQLSIAVAEITIGAAMLYTAVHSGAVVQASQWLVSDNLQIAPEALFGASTAATAAMCAAKIVGSIGVAAGGSAIAVPAWLLLIGAAALGGGIGYTAGDLFHKFVAPVPPDLLDLVGPAGLGCVGLALIVDGTRRLIKCAVQNIPACAYIKDKILNLFAVGKQKVIAFGSQAKHWAQSERMWSDSIVGGGFVGAACAGGMAYGLFSSTSAVTVFGSASLGSSLVSWGVISAPATGGISLAVTSAALVLGASFLAVRRGIRPDRSGAK